MAYQILGDVHTHTLASRHAYSTVGENVASAQARGLEVLGITEHFSTMVYRSDYLYNFQFFYNVGCWPREWNGVSLLHGAEVDLVGYDGTLFGEREMVTESIVGRQLAEPKPLYDMVTENADYVIASVHDPVFAQAATIGQATDMYVAALDKPKVFILGHTGRAGAKFDIDTVLLHAKEKHKLIEINEHSFALRGVCDDICRTIAIRCAELGVGISVSSDAHISCDIGNYVQASRMLEEIHFPEELIMDRGRRPFFAQLEAAGLALS